MTRYIPESVKNSHVYRCSGAGFQCWLAGKWVAANRATRGGLSATDRGVGASASGSSGTDPLGTRTPTAA